MLETHLHTDYRKPISTYSQSLFGKVETLRRSLKMPIILDSGCGTGGATRLLARQNTDALVIGVDKSSRRLSRGGMDKEIEHRGNCLLLRMDLVDFWRLAAMNNWQLKKHYLLYPNPWPKAKHLRRRWHAHPVFPHLLKLGGKLELRCNWRVYAEEFYSAMTYIAADSCDLNEYQPTTCLGLFERKYAASGHRLYQCCVELDNLG
ncbi:MAG: tRNA (guanosine(46)-N(7))-methyltransferase TrmB, partial [Lysobacterales bacterium]